METILYYVGQGIGVLAIVFGFVTYQTRTQRGLLLMQVAVTATFCLHYALIGAPSGMVLNMVALVRNLCYYYREKHGGGRLIPILFTVVMGAVGLASWEAWYSIFAVFGLVVNSYCVSFPDPQKVRASILVTSPSVLIYDAFVLSVGGMVYESVAIVSAAIGLLRYHKKEKNT